MRYLLTRTSARAIVALVLILVTSVLVVRATDLVGGPVEPTESPTPTAELAEATATPTETPTATPSPTATPEPAATFKLNGGGAKNIVIAFNQFNARFVVRGRIDLNQTGAQRVAPVNFAYAKAMVCTGCNTLAIAAQITLYKPGASLAVPQNSAVAVNAGCDNCFTGAWAIQYFLPLDDVTHVPADVDEAVRKLDAAMRGIERDATQGTITLDEAFTRLDAVLADFRGIGGKLDKQTDVETAPDTPTPFPSPPPEPTESPADTPTETAAPTDTATP